MLEVTGLNAGYEDVLVLDGVSMGATPGSTVAIVGPNGAGKSTLLKAVYGLARVRSGRVVFRRDGAEHEITGWPPHRLTTLGLNYVPQTDNVFAALSVRENLLLGATARPRQAQARMERLLIEFGPLRAVLDRLAGALSGGQRQSLAVARALMSEPALLLLDEPSAGLAPEAVRTVFGHLGRLRKEGLTIVIVEQNARLALASADNAYVLEGGRNRYEGPGQKLLEDARVVELYLGGSGAGETKHARAAADQ
ncbi:ABC transporter ATP-binding protein [Candidatus Dormiibacter inghamiae]